MMPSTLATSSSKMCRASRTNQFCRYGLLLSVVGICLQLVLTTDANPEEVVPGGKITDSVDRIVVEMLHRDHIDSPLRGVEELSLSERYAKASQRSRARAQALRSYGRKASDLGRIAPAQRLVSEGLSSPVFSQLGEYIMHLTLGTPAKTFTTIVDTGSDLIWVQCNPCKRCFRQPEPFFDPSKSSTYQILYCGSNLCSALRSSSCVGGCMYSYSYGDGSFTDGVLSTDTATFTTTNGNKTSVPGFAFGCGRSDLGDFAGSDGLVGLGAGTISLISQMAPAWGNRFSTCLVTFSDATTKSSSLIIGNGAEISDPAVRFTPLLHNSVFPSFYYVGVEGISVDGQRLIIPSNAFAIDPAGNGGTILDSGTTLYFLIQEAYDALEATVDSLVKYPRADSSNSEFERCYNLSSVRSTLSSISLPIITIHLTGADLLLPQGNAFVPHDSHGTTCLTFIPTYGFSIIGNLQQQNFLFSYDREHSKLGFVPKQCDTFL